MNNKSFAISAMVLGAVILLASILADSIGLDDQPGLGFQQIIGTILGVVALGVGIFLNKSGNPGSANQPDDARSWLDSLTKAEEVGGDEQEDIEGK